MCIRDRLKDIQRSFVLSANIIQGSIRESRGLKVLDKPSSMINCIGITDLRSKTQKYSTLFLEDVTAILL